MRSKDILVIVPPGTRVRYIESPYTNDEVLMMDASNLGAKSFKPEPLDQLAKLSSVPIYNAEPYTNDDILAADVGVVELGGAIGRHATTMCRQGAHDLCSVSSCGCRCHE
jgi:hypothetical protein